ncbi:MAG: pyruvate, phosphate dikinase [Cyclobacteriaceae bacterium]
MATAEINTKRVYLFGNGTADGKSSMKPLLGGKGANLAEMSRIGLPVPSGFTITTDVCTEYHELGKENVKLILRPEVRAGVQFIEERMGAIFGDRNNPLLLSVRSGARDSMPGMMDTVLDIGLNDDVVEGLAEKSGKPHFAWDSYRRFIQMYGDVVMKVNRYVLNDQDVFEEILENIKESRGVKTDQELSTADLIDITVVFKNRIKELTGLDFPQDPGEQLWNSIIAVFESWHTPRAIVYRKLNSIPEEWGTAVNVQAMVYGNMGNRSASGVAFTRDAATGENIFNGEYLIDAQGEDVVAGIRTPHQITLEGSQRWANLANVSEDERKKSYTSLEEYMPEAYKELLKIEHILEDHFRDMQDLEFTIQEEKLWILQTRNGKRTGEAMVRIGMEMLDEGTIDEATLLKRIDPNKVDELLHPIFDHDALANATPIAKGLPASPGAATGQIVFQSDDATQWNAKGKDVILVRVETSPEDLAGMDAARGILTARGGMTSHAAVVARGMGKCCISGAGSLKINYEKKTVAIDQLTLKEGDWISINGSTGYVYNECIKTKDAELTGNFGRLIELADKHAKMKIHANADTPETARIAREFGAEGVGLCRTEHMFFEEDRIMNMREMILADDETGRKIALDKLLPMQRSDFEGILEVMAGFPVTIRLLDPPLHEFLPHEISSQKELAHALNISLDTIRQKIEDLSELNPMLGHRGCRLGNTYPEITQMQARAIIEAALNLKDRGVTTKPEIMIPLTGTVEEFKMQVDIVRETIKNIFIDRHDQIDYRIGTMIEVPRACLIADKIAKHADFFSFGTNDLTQMTFGYSRDDAGKFLPIYLDKGLLNDDPFQVLDQEGVGQLVNMGIQKGRMTQPKLSVGICGEHGGEPRSVEFCHIAGMNYVSCSPYRVPIAKVAAAKANMEVHS